ncbi:hypothetical protein BOX15_Mlig007387g1 [Macrostomum lignano]|uniref:Uncharacterized protein n=2 Tax=Macrostomum lignano TaxID=282301 RepID=A0A267EGK1_9PLAT|nr:hypothetical protein BOX15_Mlig007387g2 [Macrostomum lignano]PAA67665.1 hypothetical protein BOX15_Mlig012255g1 [Macrostomum lignano]PAA69630.1 hypothetical protein BOX15_Mlig007387g1 [Macrostomum lignano]
MPNPKPAAAASKPKPPTQAARASRRRDSETGSHSVMDFGEDMFGGGKAQKPDDQLQLTDQELKEEFTRILTANNPHAPQNIVRYSFKDRQYKPIPQVDQLAVHFVMEGNLIHRESDEAKKQLEKKSGDAAREPIDEAAEASEGEAPPKEEGDEDAPAPAASGKKLTNQFNFCERATQTYNNPLRERENQTEPPPRVNFSQTANQWIIFDAYQADFEKNQEKGKEKKGGGAGKGAEEKARKRLTVMDTQADDLAKIEHAVKMLERMVNQNSFDEIAQDFKYWEDPSDEFRDQQGTLLPLWKFGYEKARKLAVTSITWSPKYHDLFAIAYGSYDFMKQTRGLLCFYSLKNPSHPEYVFETDSAVLTAALHPEYPHMLCAGLYDGSVAVYSAVQKKRGPLYQSSARTGKHTDPVWQVCWAKDDLDNNMNFYSTSSDGRVTSWTLIKNDLVSQDVIKLELEGGPVEGPDGIKLENLASGTTFDFHREASHLFLVGTEEGKVFKCSTAYSSQYLQTYDAHHMAVYKVTWNPFHPSIFMTCSADWTVKIWDHNKTEPVFVFDLNSPVGDAAWSPYSSTVFAAVTADGKVHVFDLNINKYEALCEQVVAQKKKAKLTHIDFNPKHPILIVGDDRGHISSLKLSPNLRKLPKEKKGAAQPGPQAQVEKLDKILTMVG